MQLDGSTSLLSTNQVQIEGLLLVNLLEVLQVAVIKRRQVLFKDPVRPFSEGFDQSSSWFLSNTLGLAKLDSTNLFFLLSFPPLSSEPLLLLLLLPHRVSCNNVKNTSWASSACSILS